MATLIAWAFALGCALLVLSLPLSMTAVGRGLRRAGCFVLLLALSPALIVGLLAGNGPSGAGRGASLNILEWIGLATVLSLGAAATLAIRKRLTRPGRDAWSEWVSQRSSGKQPLNRPTAAAEADTEDLP